LIEISARLLAEEGPESMSSRRIAKKAGTSTMAVYTHFGSMSGLVREMVHEGFDRLANAFDRIEWSDDPVLDMALIGRVYRRTAKANAPLYSVMFGDRTLAGFELGEEDRQHGRKTFVRVVECATRCIAGGRFRDEDEALVAHHMWLATHGTVTLELGGYLVGPSDADWCFESQLVTLMVGAGDTFEAASASVRDSARVFGGLFGTEASPWPDVTRDGLDGRDGRRERPPGEGR
jgi:AcrR family transcriptional regulator